MSHRHSLCDLGSAPISRRGVPITPSAPYKASAMCRKFNVEHIPACLDFLHAPNDLLDARSACLGRLIQQPLAELTDLVSCARTSLES